MAIMEIQSSMEEDEKSVVIVGAGICGLATALALHRKGIKSLVLERADSLGATGTTIGIQANGWRALDQLGVGPLLRPRSLLIERSRDISLADQKPTSELSFRGEEVRCVKRSDLIETLAYALPRGTIHFNCKISAVGLDSLSSFPIIQLENGSIIHAKVLIGCDGVNSIVAEFLKLKTPRIYPMVGVRALTDYPRGHGFSHEMTRIFGKGFTFGRVPIDPISVFWFMARPSHPSDSSIAGNPQSVIDSTVEAAKNFPSELVEMMKKSDLDSVNLTRLRYRSPWDLLRGSFCRETITVAGDAMHVMGPFLGQGGAAGLEDAVVLARCLSKVLSENKSKDGNKNDEEWRVRVGVALDQYVNERRARIFKLSLQTYLTGVIIFSTSVVVKLMVFFLIMLLFGGVRNHTTYDCGQLRILYQCKMAFSWMGFVPLL